MASSSSTPSPVTAEKATDPGYRSTRRGGGLGVEVGLVEHQQLGHAAGLDLAQHGVDGLDLAGHVGGGRVDHVHEQVGVGHDLERGLERLDQLVGQLAHEADGVGEQHRLAAGQVEAAGGGVEGGEEPVLDQHAGVGEAVEQRRLAGVGVADDGHPLGAGLACGACAGCRGAAGCPCSSASSLWMRRTRRRRSTSSWVSPGPREPMRAPPPADMPPACWENVLPVPRRRGSR